MSAEVGRSTKLEKENKIMKRTLEHIEENKEEIEVEEGKEFECEYTKKVWGLLDKYKRTSASEFKWKKSISV